MNFWMLILWIFGILIAICLVIFIILLIWSYIDDMLMKRYIRKHKDEFQKFIDEIAKNI